MAHEDEEPFISKGAKVIAETAKALRITFDGQTRWVPKSVIHDDSEVYDAAGNAEGKLVIRRWWADENKL